jgi:hypothetical protein
VTPLYPQKLALTSPTGGGRSVGIVRSRTKAMEFSFSLVYWLIISSFSWSVNSNLIGGARHKNAQISLIIDKVLSFESPWTQKGVIFVGCYWGEAWWSDWVTWLRQIGWHSVYWLWHSRLSVSTPRQACLSNCERCQQVFFFNGSSDFLHHGG